MSEYLGFKLERNGPILTLTLNRPERRNALTGPLATSMADALIDAVGDGAGFDRLSSGATHKSTELGPWIVLVRGAGGAFCAGLDLKESAAGRLKPDETLAALQRFNRTLRDIPAITIAAVEGPAAGFGADLTLACDLRVASEKAAWGEKFGHIGLVADGGATFALAPIVGRAKAMELLLSGRMLSAEEARRMGLFAEVWPTDSFDDRLDEYVTTLSKGAPLAMVATKRMLWDAPASYDQALEREGEVQMKLLATKDFLEGVQAFIQKRQPRFSGR